MKGARRARCRITFGDFQLSYSTFPDQVDIGLDLVDFHGFGLQDYQ